MCNGCGLQAQCCSEKNTVERMQRVILFLRILCILNILSFHSTAGDCWSAGGGVGGGVGNVLASSNENWILLLRLWILESTAAEAAGVLVKHVQCAWRNKTCMNYYKWWLMSWLLNRLLFLLLGNIWLCIYHCIHKISIAHICSSCNSGPIIYWY